MLALLCVLGMRGTCFNQPWHGDCRLPDSHRQRTAHLQKLLRYAHSLCWLSASPYMDKWLVCRLFKLHAGCNDHDHCSTMAVHMMHRRPCHASCTLHCTCSQQGSGLQRLQSSYLEPKPAAYCTGASCGILLYACGNGAPIVHQNAVLCCVYDLLMDDGSDLLELDLHRP